MDYLRGNQTASATGLFVVCRYLSGSSGGQTEQDLRRALQLLRSEVDDSGPILTASLNVGEGLGLLVHTQQPDTWRLAPETLPVFQGVGDLWPAFRGELLRKVADHGLSATSDGAKVPDLVRGLTLLMQSDPLSPLADDWGKGPEAWFEELGFDAIANSTQWNAFKRWAVSLGLAHRAGSAKPAVVVPDATTAIADQLDALPASGTAREWLASLRERLPVLGAASLTQQLPPARPWDEVPPAVVLGLLKLENAGALTLEPSDDAGDVISMGLGATKRQIGRIQVRNERG